MVLCSSLLSGIPRLWRGFEPSKSHQATGTCRRLCRRPCGLLLFAQSNDWTVAVLKWRLPMVIVKNVLPPFHKSRNALPKFTLTLSIANFQWMKRLCVNKTPTSSQLNQGPWPVGHEVSWQGGSFNGLVQWGGKRPKWTSPITRGKCWAFLF